jgi:hypothetical protein
VTSHWTLAAPYAPRQAPDSDKASTISGFELSPTSSIDEHYRLSPSVSGQNTPVSDTAPIVSQPDDQVLSTPSYAALVTRVKQLLQENELLAQEIRDMQRVKKERMNRKKQKKERRDKEKKARLRAEIVREAMRLMTAILTPMPEGSLARIIVVAVEALFLWKME